VISIRREFYREGDRETYFHSSPSKNLGSSTTDRTKARDHWLNRVDHVCFLVRMNWPFCHFGGSNSHIEGLVEGATSPFSIPSTPPRRWLLESLDINKPPIRTKSNDIDFGGDDRRRGTKQTEIFPPKKSSNNF